MFRTSLTDSSHSDSSTYISVDDSSTSIDDPSALHTRVSQETTSSILRASSPLTRKKRGQFGRVRQLSYAQEKAERARRRAASRSSSPASVRTVPASSTPASAPDAQTAKIRYLQTQIGLKRKKVEEFEQKLKSLTPGTDAYYHLEMKIQGLHAKITTLEQTLSLEGSSSAVTVAQDSIAEEISEHALALAALTEDQRVLQAELEQKIGLKRERLERLERDLIAATPKSLQHNLLKIEITAARAEIEALEKSLPTAEEQKSIYSSVRFFREYKHKTTRMKIISVIFAVFTLPIRLLVDGFVFITNTYIEGVLPGKIKSGAVSKLAVKTVVDTAGSEEVVKTVIKSGEEIIEALGNKGSVILQAVFRNKASHRAITDALAGLVKNPDIKQGIADFIGSPKIKSAIKAFIEEQAETVVGVGKRIFTDEELQRSLTEFSHAFLADTATATGFRAGASAAAGIAGVVDQATFGLAGGACMVGGAAVGVAQSTVSSLKEGARRQYGSVHKYVRSWLGRTKEQTTARLGGGDE